MQTKLDQGALRRRAGFTLVELMVVVVIIGILAALAIPRFSLVSHQAKIKEAELILKHVHQAQSTWKVFAGEQTEDLADLESIGYTAPVHMEFYLLPAAEGGYALPLCLVSRNPDEWPSRQVDEDGVFSDC